MAVNLQKGQSINLSSAANKVSGVIIGLGWDSARAGSASVDCDASAILCKMDGKMYDVIYFGKMRSENDGVVYSGDSQTGDGNGDNERIYVNFTKLPQQTGRIVIAANIYDAKAKRQHFGMINNAFVRAVNWRTGEEICRFNLTDNYSGMTGIIAAEIIRTAAGWTFVPDGKAVQEASRLQSIVKLFE